MRIVLVAAVLLLAGCTAQPVSAPPASAPSPTPWTVPSFTNDPSYLGCPDVVPSDLLTEILGEPIPGAWESRVDGWIGCPFRRWGVSFTVESSAEAFAQRREQQVASRLIHPAALKEVPDFYDEAYEFSVSAESEAQTYVVARQESAEVSLHWYHIGPHDIASVKDELFAAIFERLG